MTLTMFITIVLSAHYIKRLSLLLLLIGISACGQMGPLYLPVDETATSSTSISPSTIEH